MSPNLVGSNGTLMVLTSGHYEIMNEYSTHYVMQSLTLTETKYLLVYRKISDILVV